MGTENILLTADELAKITHGYWENLVNNLDIKFINYRVAGITPGDIHVSTNEFDWHGRENSEQNIDKVFENGAVAAIVRNKAKIISDKPILRVENTKKALKAIGLETSKKSNATKVLVTGSYGKTGFKTQLYHLLKQQIATNAVINSANKEIPIWRALGSIRKNDKIAIIEVAVPGPGRGKQRSRWVKPNICIITDIGLEHIQTHGGTLENVIANKSEVAKGLMDGGKFIIPQKKNITNLLLKEINKYGNFEILLFGNDEKCNAQILKQKFTDFGWDITARIEDQVINYNLPLPEEHAPLSSLSVLLTAYHLGADLNKCVEQYTSYKQYASSGHMYKLKNTEGDFFLYDQCKRGEMDAFKSTLKLIARMKPNAGGRKIVILSEFTNLEEADKSMINTDEFRSLISAANIDLLYTTHYFSEHINVLPDKNIWQNHSMDIHDLIPEIIANIKENDMVFVRGTLKSNLKELINAIFKTADVSKKYF